MPRQKEKRHSRFRDFKKKAVRWLDSRQGQPTCLLYVGGPPPKILPPISPPPPTHPTKTPLCSFWSDDTKIKNFPSSPLSGARSATIFLLFRFSLGHFASQRAIIEGSEKRPLSTFTTIFLKDIFQFVGVR